MINYYYYQTYNNYIDVFIFGLFDDDTVAILSSVWQDYPVISILSLSIFTTVIFYFITKRIIQKLALFQFKNGPYYLSVIYTLMYVITLFIAARGTIGTHPLKRYHANISNYIILNKAAPNALLLLDWAASDYKNQFKFTPIKPGSLIQLTKKVTQKESLKESTPSNLYLAKNPPNVVIALMESMGTNVLSDDNIDNNNLLASLRPHFKQDFLFKRYYAETYSTLATIMSLLVHSSIPSIGSSSAENIIIKESAMFPYKKSGYETIFIYGGNAGWRNTYNYLPKQGFNTIYDENNIINSFPEAEASKGEWGVADEYLFKFTEKLLKNSKQPLAIFILSVTNHSPHKVPSSYELRKLSRNPQSKNNHNVSDKKVLRMMEAYQYSANALGDFITQVKNSPLKNNTIISATGDHRIRSMIIKTPQQRAAMSQVPLYLYIPEKILNNVNYTYQPLRVGSHKDLFTTLYHFSLPKVEYLSLGGNNLLSKNKNIKFWGYSPEGTFDEDGATLTNQPNKTLPWKSSSNSFEKSFHTNAKSQVLFNDYTQLKSAFINKTIAGYK